MSRWQLKAIYLFSHDSRRRDLVFDLNKVNIVTGSSGSGKSALCEILDYCVGSSSCHIPGIVRDATSWVAILLSNGKTEAFIARREPPPDQLSTDEVSLSFGAHVHVPDSSEELEGNTNTSTLLRRLEQLFGIGNVTTEVFAGSRQPSKVSARNTVPFLIQDDDVIINKTVLLRGAQDDRRLSIVDSFPYFLGVSDEDSIAQEAEFRRLSAQLAAEERRIAAIERQREHVEPDLREIAAEASSVELIDLSIQDSSPERLRLALSQVTVWSPEADDDSGDDRISKLSDLRQRLFFQRSQLTAQINEAREAFREAQQFVSISERQERRLQTTELFGTSDKPLEVCPVCSNKILENTSTLTRLRATYRELQGQLASAERERPQIDDYIARLQGNIDELTGQLNSVKALIRGTLNEAEAVQERLSLTQRRLRVAGRVSYFLERVEHAEKPVSYAKRDDLRRQVAELQVSVDVQNKLDRIQDAQQEIGVSADSILTELPFPASYFGATEERATCIRQKCSRVGTGLRAVGIYKASSRAEGAAGFGFYVSSHAEGVVAACALHAHSGWAEPLEFLPCVLEVLFSHLRFEDFLDNRQEIGQGAHGGQRRSVGGPDQAAYRGQHESVLNRVQGDAALIELEGQQTVWPAQIAAGSRRFAISFQNLAHVIFAAGGLLIHGRLLSLVVRAAMVRRCLWCGSNGEPGSAALAPWSDCRGSYPIRRSQDW